VASAVERCRTYVEAGADAIFAEAVTDLRDYRAFADALPGVPLLANMTEFGKTPLYSRKELAAHGVSIALYPLSAFRAMSKAAAGVYSTIAETGSQTAAMSSLHSREETYAVIDYHKYERQVNAYNTVQTGDEQ
jgi:methylisocitrate lyase